MGNKEKENKTFLVFNTSCFGDVLLCNSLCQNIKRFYPDSKTIFICDKPFYEVAKYQKGVDEAVIYDKKGEHKGFLGLLKFLKNFKYKNAYASFVTYRNVRNCITSFLSGTKHIIEAQKLKENFSAQDKHNQWLKILTNKEIENLPIRYNVDNNIPENLQKYFDKNKKYIALCTVSKLVEKDMPLDTAVELINKINSTNEYEVLFVGAGKKAENYANELIKSNCQFTDLVNKTTIYELGQALKQCSRVISVDTGTLHFACALDLPVTAVFYKQDFVAEWAPSEKLYNVKLIKENQTAEKIVQTIY